MDIIPSAAKQNSKQSKDFFKLGRTQAQLTKQAEDVKRATIANVMQQAMMMDTANKLKDILAEVQRKQNSLDINMANAATAPTDPLAGQLPMGAMGDMGMGGGMPPMGGGGMLPMG